jgi:hypothetical protein
MSKQRIILTAVLILSAVLLPQAAFAPPPPPPPPPPVTTTISTTSTTAGVGATTTTGAGTTTTAGAGATTTTLPYILLSFPLTADLAKSPVYSVGFRVYENGKEIGPASAEAKNLALYFRFPMPRITDVRFGERLYQKGLVAKGEKFVVSATPKLSAKVESDYAISAAGVSITAQGSDSGALKNTMNISEVNQTSVNAVAGEVRGFSFAYDVPAERRLAEGDNIMTISAADSLGAVTTETFAVTVMGGPLQVIGPVLVYPAPFSITKHGQCEIQYVLSRDADLELYIIAGTAQTIKKFSLFAGQNGGAAGYNKVIWDGVTDFGIRAGNAVYVGSIVSRYDGKLLAQFKFSVVD